MLHHKNTLHFLTLISLMSLSSIVGAHQPLSVTRFIRHHVRVPSDPANSHEDNFYTILGLHKDDNPSKNAIIKAKQCCSKRWHPDKFVNENQDQKVKAEQKIKDINLAASVLTHEETKKSYDQYVYPKGATEWSTYLTEMKIYEKRQKIEEIEEEFTNIFTNPVRLVNKQWHDRNGMNYLQRYYIDSIENFENTLLASQIYRPDLTQVWLNETYQDKTLFYQILENESIAFIPLLMNAGHKDFFGRPKNNAFFNHHPRGKPHPLKLFLKISNDRLSILSMSSNKKDIQLQREFMVRQFIQNGLDQEGQEVLAEFTQKDLPQDNVSNDSSLMIMVTFMSIVLLLKIKKSYKYTRPTKAYRTKKTISKIAPFQRRANSDNRFNRKQVP